MNELLKMAEELAFCVGGKNNFLNLYHQVISKNKYGFLYLDVVNQRAYDGFDNLLWSEETHGTAVFDVKRINFSSNDREKKQLTEEEEKK